VEGEGGGWGKTKVRAGESQGLKQNLKLSQIEEEPPTDPGWKEKEDGVIKKDIIHQPSNDHGGGLKGDRVSGGERDPREEILCKKHKQGVTDERNVANKEREESQLKLMCSIGKREQDS